MARMRASVTSRRDRLRQLGREQAELHFAGATRFSVERDRHNRGLRRMRLKIEMQQLEPERTVVRGQRRPNRSGVYNILPEPV